MDVECNDLCCKRAFAKLLHGFDLVGCPNVSDLAG